MKGGCFVGACDVLRGSIGSPVLLKPFESSPQNRALQGGSASSGSPGLALGGWLFWWVFSGCPRFSSKRGANCLSCYWVGSLDFNFSEIKLGFPPPPRKRLNFLQGGQQQPSCCFSLRFPFKPTNTNAEKPRERANNYWQPRFQEANKNWQGPLGGPVE